MTAPVSSLLDHLRADLSGQYRVEAEIGQGASATVYRAFDLKHARAVALKLLRPDLAATITGERFLREITIAAQLQHPHILPVLDSGAAAGSYYFAMPVVNGITLRERLRRGPPLGIGEAVRILLDVADALAYAHEQGVVHRDIKPDNIMLAGRHAVVMDFGVAKALNQPGPDRHLTTGVAIGTPAYMAPEQATASSETDHRADIYALGIVGYELLAGRPPFTGQTAQEVLTAQVVLTAEPLRSRRPDVPEPVAQVIERCLEKAPAARWQSAADIVDRLDNFATPSGELTPAAMRRPKRRMPWIAMVIGVVAIAMLSWDLRLRRASESAAPAPRPERRSFLGTVREASLSPDGSLLAYVTADSAGQRLWVEDVSGSGRPIQLAASERIVGVAWTSQGTEVSFAEGPADRPVTRAVSRLGGAGRVVGIGRGILSPDGTMSLIATGGDPRLMVIRRAQNDTIRLRRPGDGWLSGIAWAPTSDRLALTILTSDKAGSTIALLGLDGTVTTLTDETRPTYGPAWSPNGRSLYYLGSGRTGRDLIRLDLARPEQRVVVASGLAALDESRRYPTGTFLSIGRDERQAVFVEEEQWSNLARFVIDQRGAVTRPEPTLFTMGTALYTSARLSPDGQRLAVFVSRPRGTSLGTVAVDGNAIEEISLVDFGGQVTWSPDGRSIAYSAGAGDSGIRLSIHDLTTGGTRRATVPVGLELAWGGGGVLIQQPGNHGLLHVDPTTLATDPVAIGDSAATGFMPKVSPDGRSVALLQYASGTGPVALSIYDTNSRTTRALLAGAYRPIGWSANGAIVYAVRNTFAPAPEEILAVPVRGGLPRPIANLPPGYYSEDLSADGKLLIATQLMSRSETWQLALPAHR